MYKLIDDILTVTGDKEDFYFDPENLILFSSAKDSEKNKIVQDYKKNVKRNPFKQKKYNLDTYPRAYIELHLTDECNLKCKYCYLQENCPKSMKAMSEETIEKAFNFTVQNFPNAKSIHISLFGGEPLLFWKKFDFLLNKAEEIFKEKKFYISMPTNGTIYNKKIHAFLKKSNVSFCMSIDGNEKIQDFLRPTLQDSSSYKTLDKNLPKFQALNNSLLARATITPHNLNLTDLFAFFQKKGFKKISFALCSSAEFQIEEEKLLKEWEKLAQFYLNHIIKDEKIIEITSFFMFFRNLHFGTKKSTYCNHGRNMFAVSIDEKLYSCHRFVGDDKRQIGDLDNGFNKESTYLGNLLNFDIEKSVKCKKCFAKYLCAGGCAHEQVSLPSMLSCKVIKHILYLSILIYSELLTNHPKAFKKLEALLVKKA
ncbi:MAG: Anaerobic sulfatase-maturating enzyme [Candidatus Anoxychlamydiales bacterium]|nr:Anaerobic sulfatase-maturating enzyme [Candidatus Anoxychlamydiales bacterium]